MDERVWCGWTWLACTTWPQPEHLWDALEWRLRARPSSPTSVCDLTNALMEEWSKIPINTLLNIMESLPRRAEAVRAAKGRPILYQTLWNKNRISLKFICKSRQASEHFWQNSVYLLDVEQMEMNSWWCQFSSLLQLNQWRRYQEMVQSHSPPNALSCEPSQTLSSKCLSKTDCRELKMV